MKEFTEKKKIVHRQDATITKIFSGLAVLGAFGILSDPVCSGNRLKPRLRMSLTNLVKGGTSGQGYINDPPDETKTTEKSAFKSQRRQEGDGCR